MQEKLMNSESPIRDKKALFEKFKETEGQEMVQMIKVKVDLLKKIRAELNLCISTCNELKEKIDLKLRLVNSNDKRSSKAGTEEEYKLQMDIKRLKTEHEEFLGEYKRLKKQFRQEDKNLLAVKRDLLSSFENQIRFRKGPRKSDKQGKMLKNMDSGELVFLNAQEKFQTIKKLKRMEKG
jgi:hypothetical protein